MSESIWPIGVPPGALDGAGRIEGKGKIPADEDGLARLVLELGVEVSACVETILGHYWITDTGKFEPVS